MRIIEITSIGLMFCASFATAADPINGRSKLYPQLRTYLEARVAEFDQIPDERKEQLKRLSTYVKKSTESNQSARLTFICTHNSRRSHVSQIWAATAANFYGVDRVETYSGGTEATAFNPRAIAAVKRAGLKVDKIEDGKNPRYAVRFENSDHPLVCFSKAYHEAPNPKKDFCAVMTCTQADKNCPIVAGCSIRVAIPFDDPKMADDQPNEVSTYDEQCQQICREMMYLFSQVRASHR